MQMLELGRTSTYLGGGIASQGDRQMKKVEAEGIGRGRRLSSKVDTTQKVKAKDWRIPIRRKRGFVAHEHTHNIVAHEHTHNTVSSYTVSSSSLGQGGSFNTAGLG